MSCNYLSNIHPDHRFTVMQIGSANVGWTCRLCGSSVSKMGQFFCYSINCKNQSTYTPDPMSGVCTFCTSTHLWACTTCPYKLCALCGGKNIYYNFLEKFPSDILMNISSHLPLNTTIQFESVCKQFYNILIKRRTELSIPSHYQLTHRDILRLCHRYSNPCLTKLIFKGVFKIPTIAIAAPKKQNLQTFLISEAIQESFPSLVSVDLSENELKVDDLKGLLEMPVLQELKLNNIEKVAGSDWCGLFEITKETKLKTLEAKGNGLSSKIFDSLGKLGISVIT